LEPYAVFALILLASSLIYCGGMVLNDYYDRRVDAEQRPNRPIPSGAIAEGTARTIGYSMLFTGIMLALLGGFLGQGAAIAWRGGIVALLLSICVILYDALLKKTMVAPWLMGMCRVFNVLLGMSLAAKLPPDDVWQFAGYDASQLFFAFGIGLYIAGVTWFARNEAAESPRSVLIFGAVLMAMGIGLVGGISLLADGVIQLRTLSATGFWSILVLLSLALFRRAIIAIHRPDPKNVQQTIKQGILSLIFFNAAITLAACGTMWSVVIVALLIPMLGLRRFIAST